MLEWLSVNFNFPTIVLTLIIVAIVVLDIRKLLNDRKKGCNACGGSCSGCSGCSTTEIPERFRAKKGKGSVSSVKTDSAGKEDAAEWQQL